MQITRWNALALHGCQSVNTPGLQVRRLLSGACVGNALLCCTHSCRIWRGEVPAQAAGAAKAPATPFLSPRATTSITSMLNPTAR